MRFFKLSLFYFSLLILSACAKDELPPLIRDNPYASYENETSLEFISGEIIGNWDLCRVELKVAIVPTFRIEPSNVCHVSITKGFGAAAKPLADEAISIDSPTLITDLEIEDCLKAITYTVQLHDCDGFKAGNPLSIRVTQ